jgi:hypothetical protein
MKIDGPLRPRVAGERGVYSFLLAFRPDYESEVAALEF